MRRPIAILRNAWLVRAAALLSALASQCAAYASDDGTPPALHMGGSGDPFAPHGVLSTAHGVDQGEASGGHAAIPAGVFGAHMVTGGAAMITYTPMVMSMQQNYVGSSTISPTAVVTTVPYVPLGVSTMKPPTLRIAPTSMTVEMNMFHAMYGVTDWLNVMAMGALVDKSMTMVTYAGMKGATQLGVTTASTRGWSDTAVTGLVRLYQDQVHHVHLNLGMSLPTGSNDEQITMLSPMNKYMTKRANYGMQIGTGTYDGLYGVTYTGKSNVWSWGAVYRGRAAFGDNGEGYHWGPSNEVSVWGGYELADGLNITGRAAAAAWDRIHGFDPLISGPMQGNNPYFYGGERIKLLGGVEYIARSWGLPPIRVAVEAGAPVYQRLNGPQMGESWQFNAALGMRF